MNISWNQIEKVFVAEFSADFQGDLEAVKLAGFRTFGPPNWLWYAPPPGIKALNRLREHRPASDLTISPEALAVYQPLAEREAKNAEVKKALADAKKKVKKEQVEKEEEAATTSLFTIPKGKIWVGPEDLPPKPPFVSSFTPPPPPDMKCHICGQPVYFYELQEPIPLCLWCEKQKYNND
jgi:hypothetical protein